MRVGSLLPRKEVGLDLFFPSQMQENLKVRGVRLGVGGAEHLQAGCGGTPGCLGVSVCVHQGCVWGRVCVCTRGGGLAHACEGVFWRRRARVCTHEWHCVGGGDTHSVSAGNVSVHTCVYVAVSCTHVRVSISARVVCLQAHISIRMRTQARPRVPGPPGGAGCPRAVASSLPARSPSSSAR